MVECEPRLAALEKLVDAAVLGTAGAERWCANAFHGTAVKPFLELLTGWERGLSLDEADDPDRLELQAITLSQLRADADDDARYRRPATSVYERMLRTSEAFDVGAEHLYAKLPDCRGCYCL